jgi:hypothetical protein
MFTKEYFAHFLWGIGSEETYVAGFASRIVPWKPQSIQHRVGRVLSFSSVIGIGTPPTPRPQVIVPTPLVLGRGAHSLAREGVGEPQFSLAEHSTQNNSRRYQTKTQRNSRRYCTWHSQHILLFAANTILFCFSRGKIINGNSSYKMAAH